MAVTIKDVARLAKVSVGTVSRYLNGHRVTEQNRVRIERAIKELDFRVNPIAKTLRTNRSMTVAVLVPSLSNIFSMSIIENIERYLEPHGYSVIVCSCSNDPAKEREKLEFVKSKAVDGVIVMPVSDQGSHIEEVAAGELPVVLIDRLTSDFQTDAVVVDNTNAVYHAVEQLIIRGHRHIGLIAGPQSIYTARERLEGYRRVMADYGLPIDPDLIVYGDYQAGTGHDLMKKLMTQSRPPSAVLVSNYEMTIGAITCLQELGTRIPEDLSVVGFDHLELSVVVNPPLAVVVQPREQIGTQAAKLLYRRLSGDKNNYPTLVRLKTEFVEGRSIASII